MSSSSSWPLILVSDVHTDLFERCIWSTSQKTGWIFSLVRLGLFTALAWTGEEGLQNKWGFEKEWPLLYSWIMPQELIYCTSVWRAAAAPPEAGAWRCGSRTSSGMWSWSHPKMWSWRSSAAALHCRMGCTMNPPKSPPSAPYGSRMLVWWRGWSFTVSKADG